MPRKKRTRAGRTKLSRAAKTVENQLEDLSDVSMCSMVSEGPSSKEELLAIFLQDFDNGVEKRIQQIRAAGAKAITDQRNLLKMELLKIPKDIRKMKMVDFLKAGGSMDTLMLNEAGAIEDAAISVDSLRNPLQDITTQNKTMSTVQGAGTQQTKRRTRATKTPMLNKTAGRVTRAQMRAVANSQETPAKQFMDMATPMMSQFAFQTPMITPKFDPRLPVTTGRKAKKGETLISLAGSPVMTLSGNQRKSIGLSFEDGKSPKISGSLLEMSPNSLMNQEDQLLKLRNILDSKIQQIGKVAGDGNIRQ